MKSASLKEVKIPVQVVLGESELTVEQMAHIGKGAIIELTSLADDPVEVRAGGEMIARGEVVIVDEYFGVRITSIVGSAE